MSRLLCCLCARSPDMGAALSHLQEGEPGDGAGLAGAPPTMADVIRERKKKAGGAGLGTLRRRLAAAARRPREARPDRGCEHARFIRSVVAGWRVAEVVVLCEQLEAGAALRDLSTQAELAREPAPALHTDLLHAYRARWWCDVELVGRGWSVWAHRALLAARCRYFRELLANHPPPAARVPLTGAAAELSRDQLDACLAALYGARTHSLCKWECGSEGDLDIINVDNNGTCGSLRSGGGCGCGRGARAGEGRRLEALLGYSPDSLHTDMRYLLDSGEMADSRLVFRLEAGCGAAYGFRAALELPCHRLVLAARSRFFRSVMSRRTSSSPGGGTAGGGCAGSVCVDEKVLPRRFARALLHAAYTDQVDLSLIGRGSTSPSSTATTNSSSWSGVRSGCARPASAALLEDAFQLYEIARFLEMAIVVQGCEDAIVEALSPDTLPAVLRWAAAPHASHWVHRQAMRYLRDEFPTIMASPAAARLPRAALAEALGSPFLQASEAQALRALLRGHQHRESGAAWSAGGSVPSRAGLWRREAPGGGAAGGPGAPSRHPLAPLVALVRTEHLPHDHDLIQQAVRRGMLEAPPAAEESNSPDAWLGRGTLRAARCFLPHLDELRALLLHQPVPHTEVARLRRTRLTHRIPDTLYMVAAARSAAEGGPAEGPAQGGADAACVSPRLLAALRDRHRELAAAPPAARALKLPAIDTQAVHRQIALRCVREMSLPDGCAELLLADLDAHAAQQQRAQQQRPHRESCSGEEWEPTDEPVWSDATSRDDCCRRAGMGAARCMSAGSLRSAPSLHIPIESSRPGTCRRELPSRPESATHRSAPGEWPPAPGGAPGGPPGGGAPLRPPRLSARVPDVAMAPNANTHLLTALDYCRHPPHEYSGGVLQLDLGDGATHTPRPGSRALRSARRDVTHAHTPAHTYAQGACASGGSRQQPSGGDELRAALELSVIRAYGALGGASAAAVPGRAARPGSYRAELPARAAALGARASPSPSGAGGGSAGASGGGPAGGGPSGGGPGQGPHLPELAALTPTRLRSNDDRGGEATRSTGGSPRRARIDSTLYRRDYRLDPNYGSSGSGSRGHSPNNYA